MKRLPILTLIVLVQVFGVGFSQAQSAKVIGTWTVDVAFANGVSHSLRVDARDGGKGSFLLVDSNSQGWESGKASEAKWTQSNENSVTFSGAMEFLIGNVGRDAGTLVLKGKLGSEGSISGEAMFFPLDQNPTDPKAKPSKSGTFKALRTAGG